MLHPDNLHWFDDLMPEEVREAMRTRSRERRMKLGIVGGGVVGRATARAFLEHVEEVRVHDVIKERATHSLADVMACELVMVCLPTPQKADSLECDLSVIEKFLSSLDECRRTRANIVIRSTVPIGTTRRLRYRYGLQNIAHSPEFLTARCAMTDAQIPARNVIGIPKLENWTPIDRVPIFRLLSELYEERFPSTPIHVMTSDESELVKLAQNAFFAVKVAYWNEVHALAAKLGLNWEAIMLAILADGRISPSHTQVPGPDGKAGYGGSCLPKDVANLCHTLQSNGLKAYMTEGAILRNVQDRERTP